MILIRKCCCCRHHHPKQQEQQVNFSTIISQLTRKVSDERRPSVSNCNFCVKRNWDFGVDVKQPLSLSVNTHSLISLCFYFPILFFCFVLTIIENIYVHTDDHNNKNLVNCYKQKQIHTIKAIPIVHIGSKMSLNNIQRSCSSQMSICSQDDDHRSISLFESW